MGFASGKTQLLGFTSSKTRKMCINSRNMLVYFALGNAKFWHRVHCPTPTPDARYFTSQWNMGFSVNSHQGLMQGRGGGGGGSRTDRHL